MSKNKLSALKNARKSDLRTEPYPYIVVQNALDEDIYQELYKSYPSDQVMVENDYHNAVSFDQAQENTRYQLSAKCLYEGDVKIPAIWQEFVEYHTSQEFLNEVLDLFGDQMIKYYPKMQEKVSTKSYRAGIRRHSDDSDKCDIAMDCQPGINTPLKEEGRVLGPHLDNSVELYAGLLYMKDPEDKSSGGDLIVNSWTIPKPKFHGKSRVKDEHVCEVARVPYGPNTLAMFMNTINSVHAVSPRQPTEYSRKLVNIIGEIYPCMPQGLFVPKKKRPPLNPLTWIKRLAS